MRRVILIISCLLLTVGVYPNSFTVSGGLKDQSNGEDLIYSTVYVKGTNIGTTTNEYGFYSLELKEGEYELVFSFIGYQSLVKKIVLNKDQKLNVELVPSSEQIEEVIVTAEKSDRNVSKNETGVVKLNMKEAKAIPVFMGEQDVIKTMQLMPGISSASESSSGFNVRGGASDQNLILLDESSVYNASHLLGFFSVFNSDAIKDMKMYKGGTPAQFGGRASSVLDLRMKEGNMKNYELSGGIGILSSRLNVEGPIVKDKGSFMIAARRTYFDLFMPYISNNENITESTMYFYDLNLKANYKFTDKDRIFVSGYLGRDVLEYKSDFGFDWGNLNSTIRWNHLFSEKLFLNTTFITSSYDYTMLLSSNTSEMYLSSGINTFELKQDYSYHLNNENNLKFGFVSSHKTFKPGDFESIDKDDNEDDRDVKIAETSVLENAIYISNEQKIDEKIKLNYGLRFPIFNVLGGREFGEYDKKGELISQQYYESDEIVKTYYAVEPRINLTYILSPTNSIKTSYNRMNQYVHLMSNSTSGTPVDYWIPSTENVKPQTADQVSLGYYHNFSDNKYEFSIETYYKKIANSIEYRDGASVMLNEHIEGDILSGDARAYGVELLLRKSKGNFTGWLSYTLSKTEKQFDEINDGDWFPATYDRTNDVSLVAMYKLSDKWSLSASWVFQTGKAVTFPGGIYEVDGVEVKSYTERNSYRMPDYHRLDLGATYSLSDTKEYKSDLVFSLYNAYGRENAYSISFEKNESTGANEANQLALFKFVPSVTWNFKF
jgi:hypothetical protein